MSNQKEGPEDVIYGRKPVLELLRHKSRHLQSIYVLEGAHFPPELKEALRAATGRGLEVHTYSRSDFERLVGGDSQHQGICATLKPRFGGDLNELILQSRQGRGRILVLDEISDPHNFGALLRTADAAGVDGVIATQERSCGLTPVARKASAGASEFVKLVFVSNLRQALRSLKEEGFWIVGTAREADAVSIYETDLPKPHALIFGSEGKGLRKLTKDTCDVLVEIPLQGAVESLNVSQAAAVLLFELVRRELRES